ncbi:MAG TPA: nucleotidyltransferase domain-containing protein [Terriglobales bacterium]|nr:nucleotidyltransferase domain-containing protein [Terriglobales bacterium]
MQDQHLNHLVQRLTTAAGNNLLSVILHGSAVTGDFHPEFSDLNILCVVNELSPAAMRALVPALNWWSAQKYPAPLFFTRAELQAAADVFPIEMLDIKDQRRLLHGEDPFPQLQVSMALHRTQLERELRTKLLLLRQHYMSVAGDSARVRQLLLNSVTNFLALFRHALIALGETAPQNKLEAARRLAPRAGFDPSPFERLLQVREGKLKAEQLNPDEAFDPYLLAIEKVIQAVDSL